MFVTNWISTTKIQKISEITNFFRHYFLSRTEVEYNTIYVAPTGKIDFASSKMTFAFPWYLDNTYGCQRVEATYTFGN